MTQSCKHQNANSVVVAPWSHERFGVSNHRQFDCLFKRFFWVWTTQPSKSPLPSVCKGNQLVARRIPRHRASTLESVFMSSGHKVTNRRCWLSFLICSSVVADKINTYPCCVAKSYMVRCCTNSGVLHNIFRGHTCYETQPPDCLAFISKGNWVHIP